MPVLVCVLLKSCSQGREQGRNADHVRNVTKTKRLEMLQLLEIIEDITGTLHHVPKTEMK